jgi:hypothetical protein
MTFGYKNKYKTETLQFFDSVDTKFSRVNIMYCELLGDV